MPEGKNPPLQSLRHKQNKKPTQRSHTSYKNIHISCTIQEREHNRISRENGLAKLGACNTRCNGVARFRMKSCPDARTAKGVKPLVTERRTTTRAAYRRPCIYVWHPYPHYSLLQHGGTSAAANYAWACCLL